MNATLTGPVATYLAQVRAELSDLPPGELEDVLEDVADHLTEVAAEFEDEPTVAALHARLGTPRQYADELRTAAGYPPRARKPAAGSAETALSWGVVAATVGPFLIVIGIFSWSEDSLAFFAFLGLVVLFGAAYLGVRALRGNDPAIVLDTSRGAAAASSLRDLVQAIPPSVRKELVTIGQPVFWVGRGMVGGGGFFWLFGAAPVAVVGALAGAAVSVWIGRRSQQDRRWLWYVVPLNLVAAVLVPAWLAAGFVTGGTGVVLRAGSGDHGDPGYYSSGLVLDGEQITNLYPFDEQGRPVRVRLYTENGRPLNLPVNDCAGTYSPPDRSIDPVSNLYPHAVIQADSTGPGDCSDSITPPFVPPPAPATPRANTPSTTPTTTPTARPTARPTNRPSTAPTGRPGVTLTVSPTR